MSDDAEEEREEREEREARLISDKQLKYVAVLQRKVGLSDEDMNALLDDLAGKEALEELDRREASELIDELHVQAKERGVDLDAQPRASDKQVGFLKSLRRRAHLTEDEFAALLQERAGVTEVEAVGRRDASALIDELLKKADGSKSGGGAKSGGAARAKAPREEGPPSPPPPPAGGYDDDPPF